MIKRFIESLFQKPFLLFLFFFSLCIVCLPKSFTPFFAFEDWSVLENPFYYGIENKKFPVTFRPLYFFLLGLVFPIFKMKAFFYYGINLILHVSCTYLIFRISYSLLTKTSFTDFLKKKTAFFSALFFLLLPSHSEPISRVGEDLSAAFFGLSSLYLYLKYFQSKSRSSLGFSLLLFLFSLLSKESAFLLPFIILSHSFLFNRKEIKNGLFLFLLYGIILCFYLLLRFLFFGNLLGNFEDTIIGNFQIKHYATSFLRGIGRSFLPGFLFKKSITYAYVGLGFFLIYILTPLILKIKRKNVFSCGLIFSGLGFIFFHLPVAFFPMLNFDYLLERYLYLPSSFLCIGLALLLSHFFETKKKLIEITCFGLVFFFAISLYGYNQRWAKCEKIGKDFIEVLSSTRQNVYLLNAPGWVNRMPLFSYGLTEILKLFEFEGKLIWEGPHQMNIDLNDSVILKRIGERAYQLQVATPAKSGFSDPKSLETPKTLEYHFVNRKTFSVRFKSIEPGATILYYSEGKLRELRDNFLP